MLAEAQRLSLLRTMGIDVYRLRAADARARADDRTSAGSAATVVVVCPRAAAAELSRFRTQLPLALGIAAARVQWFDSADARGADGPAAYVAIGTEAARALGVQLSTMQQNASTIASTGEPSALLRDAAAKRALWQALKPIARHVRAAAD